VLLNARDAERRVLGADAVDEVVVGNRRGRRLALDVARIDEGDRAVLVVDILDLALDHIDLPLLVPRDEPRRLDD